MNSAAKLSSALLVAAALSLACGADPHPAPVEVVASEPVAVSPAQDGGNQVAAGGGAAQAGAPKITADEAVHDFGAIKATDSVEHVFKVRNAGDADLKIERVERT